MIPMPMMATISMCGFYPDMSFVDFCCFFFVDLRYTASFRCWRCSHPIQRDVEMEEVLHRLRWLKPYKQWDLYHLSAGAGCLPSRDILRCSAFLRKVDTFCCPEAVEDKPELGPSFTARDSRSYKWRISFGNQTCQWRIPHL